MTRGRVFRFAAVESSAVAVLIVSLMAVSVLAVLSLTTGAVRADPGASPAPAPAAPSQPSAASGPANSPPPAAVAPTSESHATTGVPTIVTYEAQRDRLAVHLSRRDPKAFWIAQIMARVEDKRELLKRKLPQPRAVRVLFTVARNGRIESSSVEKSSGEPELDKMALAMVRRAQPFPPMPAALTDNDMTFALPVRFR